MFLENGFQAFLPKPIDITQLDQILNRLVRDKQSEVTLRKAEEMKALLERPESSHEKGGALSSAMLNRRIDGIDLAAGLKRYDNDEGVYLSLLRSYVKHSRTLLGEISSLSDWSSLPEYAIRVHGLKGASYGICADKPGKLAERLETAAKASDHEFIKANNGSLIRAVEELTAELSSLLRDAAEGEPDVIKERKPSPDTELLDRLLCACNRFKMTEIKKILTELEKYDYESDSELVGWLREQADNIEYDAMIQRLSDLLK
jgi:hypothetical protein